MNPVTAFLVSACLVAGLAVGYVVNPYVGVAFLATAALVAMSLKMVSAWQKFVIFGMGTLQSVKGAGRASRDPSEPAKSRMLPAAA